jgi:hypothetical protein
MNEPPKITFAYEPTHPSVTHIVDKGQRFVLAKGCRLPPLRPEIKGRPNLSEVERRVARAVAFLPYVVATELPGDRPNPRYG